MLSECPHCGQKLRPQWVRCPRCRQLLPEDRRGVEPAASVPSASSDEPRRGGAWMAAAGGVVALSLLVVFVSRGETSSPASLPTSAPSTAPRQPSDADTSTAPEMPAAGRAARSVNTIESNRTAAAAYSAGDFARAAVELEAAVAANPDDAEARNNLGQVLVRLGRASDALPHLTEAVRLDGQRWSYRFNRARALGLLDRWEEAVADYRAASQLLPDDHVTQYNLGLALLRVRDYAGAATALERAVAAAPEEHDFLITLGTAYVGASQSDRARLVFQRFLELAPDHPDAGKVKELLRALDAPSQ